MATAPYPLRALPVERARGESVLVRSQVTARSALGALALESGGLLIDHGWLRILGGGWGPLPDLAVANGLDGASDDPHPPGLLIVAWDVIGGTFAVDGGALGLSVGDVCYFAPDSLRWESLALGHGAFVSTMLGGAATQFYGGLRWPGWEDDCSRLPLDQGVALYPPPFSIEGRDGASVSRRHVPMRELLDFYDDAARQLQDGAQSDELARVCGGAG